RRAGTALLREAAALGVPRVAIGGITPDNAPALVAAGADLVAVIGGVFGAPDPAAAAQAYLRAFTSRAGASTLTARESWTASRRSLRARGSSHIARHRTKMTHAHSQAVFERARARRPAGVNAPVRGFKSVGGEPFFVARADGPYLHDVDGNRYIDYVGSWGPMIVGHNHPRVREAVQRAIGGGLSYGAPCAAEVEMAERLTRLVPSCEMVRMVNSGTEATLSAIRLARGATGRMKIVKFEGCYHGHGDSFLVKAGSGALTFGVPT